MKNEGLPDLFKEIGAILTGSHFVYTSGLHGSAYIDKDAIYPHVSFTRMLCQIIAGNFKHLGVEVVVGPAMGGIILAQWTAGALSAELQKDVYGVYAEKAETEAGFAFKRGYDSLVENKRVLVVEDVLTTGGSVRKVVDLIRSLNGEVVGVGAICNRGGVTPEDLGGVPCLVSLLNLELETWTEEACPLCKEGIQINTDFGKGGEFVRRQKA